MYNSPLLINIKSIRSSTDFDFVANQQSKLAPPRMLHAIISTSETHGKGLKKLNDVQTLLLVTNVAYQSKLTRTVSV